MPYRWVQCSTSSIANVGRQDAGVAKRGLPCDRLPQPTKVDNLLSLGHQCSARNKAAIPWWPSNQLNSWRHATTQPPAAPTCRPVAAETAVICGEPAAGVVSHSGHVQAGSLAGARARGHGASQHPDHDGLCASRLVLAVASSSGCLASSSLKADYSLHTADFCSYLSSSVPVWSTSPAAARPAEATPESLDGPAEANPAAPDGLAASDSGDSPRNQLIHAVSSSTGSSGIPGTGAGASDSSGSDGHSSCSSDVDNLAGAPGSDEGSAGSGGPSGPRKPAFGASHEEQSRRPLVEEAKAYLLRHFPDSADTWKLFRADDLQHAEHQKAYVALQRHLFGMRIRVELTKFDKRTLPRGIAFLDPRPASHILHNNHGKVPVWAADGSMSAPDTISVQDYVLNKHDIVLQHPEWPCVGYKLTNEEAVDEPQTTDFITYPMEFCSVLLGAHNDPGRRPPCNSWVPVRLDALGGTAQIPRWIAEVLNERYSQQEQASAETPAAAVGLAAGTARAIAGKEEEDPLRTSASSDQWSCQPAASAGSSSARALPPPAAAAVTNSPAPEASGGAPFAHRRVTAAFTSALANNSCSDTGQASDSTSGTQLDNLSTPTRSSTAVVPGSSTAAGSISSGRPLSVDNSYKELLSQLPPSKDEVKRMGRVLSAVCQAIQSIRESNKMEWRVTEVVKAGSFAKNTSLRGSSDLNIVVKIKCHAHFHHCRKKLLSAVLQHLCRRLGDGGEDEAGYGWLLEIVPQGCHVHHYIKLGHPILGVQLDVQVAEHYGDTKVQKEVLLGQLLKTAAVLEAGSVAACAGSGKQQAGSAPGQSQPDGPALRPAAASHSRSSVKNEQVIRSDVFSDRQRVTNLADLMTDVVTGVNERCDQRGLFGMGSLITITIRMMKLGQGLVCQRH